MFRGQWHNTLKLNDIRWWSALLVLQSCQLLALHWVLCHGLGPPTRSLTFNPKLNSDLLIRVVYLCSITVFLWPHSPLPFLSMPVVFFFLENYITEFRPSSSLCLATVILFSVSSGSVSRWWSGEAVWHPTHSCLAGLTGLLCLSVITPEWCLSASLCLYLTPSLLECFY